MRSILVITTVLFFYNCANDQSGSADKIKDLKVIYTTNYPLFFMTQQMAPPKVSVRFPASNTVDPSLWRPSADTIAAMQQADLIIINGASYEKWLSKVSLPPSKLVNTSARFQDQLIPIDETTTHSHGPQGAHEHAGTAITVWMDLKLATEQVRTVEQALIMLLPESTDYVTTKSQELQQQLSDLHALFVEAGENHSAHIVYSHPVYQYFQRAYDLTGPSLHLEPDQPITQEQLQALEHLQQQNPITVCIWETAPLSNSVDALETIGVTSVVVSPMGGQSLQGDFLAGLRNNLKQLHTLN